MQAETMLFDYIEADGLVKERVVQWDVMLRDRIVIEYAHEQRETENDNGGQP